MGRNSQTETLSVSVESLDVDVEFACVAKCECGAEVGYEISQENSSGTVEIDLTRHCCHLGEALADKDDDEVVAFLKNALAPTRLETIVNSLSGREYQMLLATLRGIAEAANGCLPREY